MDSIERRLVELNHMLLKLAAGEKPSLEMVDEAKRALSQSYSIETGPGNDLVVVNVGSTHETCPDPPTPPVANCCSCNKITVSEDYIVSSNDYYIGVDSEEPVTILLPESCEGTCEIIVKAQMGPPLGNRKVTITTSGNSSIDGKESYVMSVPYESVMLMCNDGKWWTV